MLYEDDSLREVDYNLFPPNSEPAKCEVKLMGSGNPESADAVLARGSKVFVASTLSGTNVTQLNQYGILWTELQTYNGFLRFQDTLNELGIPCAQLDREADHTDRIESAIQSSLDLLV